MKKNYYNSLPDGATILKTENCRKDKLGWNYDEHEKHFAGKHTIITAYCLLFTT